MTTIIHPLNTEDAASMLGISPITLRIWRCSGKGPRFTKLGDAKQAPVVYQRADLEAWIAKRTFASTAGYSPAARAAAPKPPPQSQRIAAPWQSTV
jgi:Helix-turn-helix domain